MSARGMLQRLRRAAGGGCDASLATVILTHHRGEPEPAVPPDAQRCPRCGVPHVLVIVEEIVTVGPDGKELPP